MANLCSFGVTWWAAEEPLRQIVNLFTPAIEEGVGYHDGILHLDRVFDDLDRDREHLYLDLWKGLPSDQWFEVTPKEHLSVDKLGKYKELGEVIEKLGLAVGSAWNELFHHAHQLSIGGTCKWAAPAPLAGRLCRLFPIVLCEVRGTTEDTDFERWIGTGGKMYLVDEWVDDFRKGVITYRRRDGIVLDPPVVEHSAPGDATDVEVEFLTEKEIEASNRGRDGVKAITEEEFLRKEPSPLLKFSKRSPMEPDDNIEALAFARRMVDTSSSDIDIQAEMQHRFPDEQVSLEGIRAARARLCREEYKLDEHFHSIDLLDAMRER